MLSVREYREEYGVPTNLVLCVTDRCNLACRYCFVHQSSSEMDLRTAKQAVDFLMNNIKRKQEITGKIKKPFLNFFGGEPTLCWDNVIVPLVEYVNENYPNEIQLGITTNGTLLNKERIDFLFENSIVPLLSIDGDARTQNFNRPCKNGQCSFDLIEPNIPYLLEKFPNTTFRMTIYEPTVEYLFDNVLYAEKAGFNNFYCIPDTRANFSEKGLRQLAVELQKIFTYFVGSLMLGVMPITSSIINDAFIQALGEAPKGLVTTRDIDRCGLGTTSIAVAPSGDLYACQERIGQDNKFLIGSLARGIDKERHKRLINEYRSISIVECENAERCKTCNYRNKCINVRCPSVAMDDFFKQSNTLCFWYETLYNLAQGAIQSNKSIALYKYLERMMDIELYNRRDDIC